jgi:hypothetical protein
MAMTLSTQALGSIALAAAPPGSSPSHTAFSLTSSGGPFCILGFYINAVSRIGAVAGKVEVELSRINGSGVIHPAVEIAEGVGLMPQDLVVSLGSVMSSSHSLSFHVVQWPSASGPGVPFNLEGTIVFLAEDTVTLSVSVSEP